MSWPLPGGTLAGKYVFVSSGKVMRGNVKGEPVEAVATVLDDAQTEQVYAAIGKRYGLIGHVFNFFSKLRGGTTRTVGLELRAA